MIVYINIPQNAVAGGVEALYQLADAINNIGGNSIVLFDSKTPNPVPEKYSHYNIKYSFEVENSSENWIIYPEVWTERVNWFKNMKNAIWWLSVDNNHNKFKDFSNLDIMHFYQSYYAFSHLINSGASYYLPLFDYINDSYFLKNNYTNFKENIVCYNPAKGQEITNEIIRLNPNIKFIPLTNMSEKQVIDTLSISKVYIDFGHHPGKDRIPREAAILNNCIITNFKGAACFYNDVPIYNEYKFEEIHSVGRMIEDCFNNFEYHLQKFSTYKTIIKNQKEEFINQTKQIFL
jgi:hypothetical protein